MPDLVTLLFLIAATWFAIWLIGHLPLSSKSGTIIRQIAIVAIALIAFVILIVLCIPLIVSVWPL